MKSQTKVNLYLIKQTVLELNVEQLKTVVAGGDTIIPTSITETRSSTILCLV
ncbi:hypothetical protein [Lacinutrix sp. Hel_I_90]|uniref:hypothetical protein n=1 Tax=Lacinutrix sp. Hel_I_90 TaxID=1249999 RepID=UPI000A4FF2BF|nr:hypothetical protein [Lacinutrix sp. Hel_I_90]